MGQSDSDHGSEIGGGVGAGARRMQGAVNAIRAAGRFGTRDGSPHDSGGSVSVSGRDANKSGLRMAPIPEIATNDPNQRFSFLVQRCAEFMTPDELSKFK